MIFHTILLFFFDNIQSQYLRTPAQKHKICSVYYNESLNIKLKKLNKYRTLIVTNIGLKVKQNTKNSTPETLTLLVCAERSTDRKIPHTGDKESLDRWG